MAKRAGKKAGGKAAGRVAEARSYVHAGKTLVERPEVWAAPRFRGKQAPTSYQFDSSLSPALDWDKNPAQFCVVLQFCADPTVYAVIRGVSSTTCSLNQ